MKKTMIHVYCFILCVPLLLSAAACQKKTGFDKTMKRVIFVAPQKSLPVWKQAETGFLDAAEAYGFYPEWLGSDDCDLDEMTRQINIAIAENTDAIITCPLTPATFDEVFIKAQEKGIPIITIAVDASDPVMRDAFISSDYEKTGRAQAEALYQAAGDEMKIGVIMSTYDSQNQVIQVNELAKFIENKDGCDIVATAQDFANPVTGMSVFTDMLESHPEINAVFVTSGDAVSNYGKILAEKGLQDKITLIGMDAIDSNIQAIKNHEIYGVMDQDFYQMGFLSGEYAMKLLNGEAVPPETFCDSMLVTADNVAQLHPEVT